MQGEREDARPHTWDKIGYNPDLDLDHTPDAPKVCCATANILHLESQIAVAHGAAMCHG